MDSDQSMKVPKIEVIENKIIDANKSTNAIEKLKVVDQKSATAVVAVKATEPQIQDVPEVLATTTTEKQTESAMAPPTTTTTSTATTMKTLIASIGSTPCKPIQTDIGNVESKTGEIEKEKLEVTEKEKEKTAEKGKDKETCESSIVTPDYIQQSKFSLLIHKKLTKYLNEYKL